MTTRIRQITPSMDGLKSTVLLQNGDELTFMYKDPDPSDPVDASYVCVEYPEFSVQHAPYVPDTPFLVNRLQEEPEWTMYHYGEHETLVEAIEEIALIIRVRRECKE